MDQSARVTAETILHEVHHKALEPIPIGMFECLHIGFNASDVPIVSNPDKQCSALMVEKAGNRFEYDLLELSVVRTFGTTRGVGLRSAGLVLV